LQARDIAVYVQKGEADCYSEAGDTYIKTGDVLSHNIEARSYNHCCSRKAIK
jgi:hypothetical protein